MNFKKINFKGYGYKIGANKALDWLLLLGSFVLLGLAFALFSMNIYDETQGLSANGTATSTSEILSKENINRIIDFYSERRSSVGDLSEIPLIVDPSH